MNKYCLLFFLMAMYMVQLSAQSNGTGSQVTLSGYLETYYGNDFGNAGTHDRPSFMYSFTRRNEITPNMAMLKAAYVQNKIRANVALAAGTYMNSNLAAEPGVLKNIYEANAGVKLSDQKNVWLDAGIFSSHIGFESAIGKDCWNLTRTMSADNSPYYESGVKLSYTTANEKWLMSVLLLNGWQRIQRVPGNNTIGIGHQVTFKPDSSITLNSSSFIGNDKPDTAKQMRYFHNFYGIFQISKQFAVITGFDIGAEQKTKNSKQYNYWYTPAILTKWKLNNKSTLAARLEYYSDANAVIINSGTPNGFKTWGYSINYDLLLNPMAVWRIEARGFSSKDKIFMRNNNTVNNQLLVTTSLAISF